MGMVTRMYNKATTAKNAATNGAILKGVGVDLNTVLTPKNKRKKRAGLIGADPEELIPTVLGG